MQKDLNIILNYFSLLTKHINEVAAFNNQTNIWLFSSGNYIYYEALTDYFFRKNLLSFPRRVMVTVQEISSSNMIYLTKVRKLANILEILMKEESYDQK